MTRDSILLLREILSQVKITVDDGFRENSARMSKLLDELDEEEARVDNTN